MHELQIMLRSTAMVPPGQLAMRREAALQVLEELIDALGRLEKARRALDEPLADQLVVASRWRSVPAPRPRRTSCRSIGAASATATAPGDGPSRRAGCSPSGHGGSRGSVGSQSPPPRSAQRRSRPGRAPVPPTPAGRARAPDLPIGVRERYDELVAFDHRGESADRDSRRAFGSRLDLYEKNRMPALGPQTVATEAAAGPVRDELCSHDALDLIDEGARESTAAACCPEVAMVT